MAKVGSIDLALPMEAGLNVVRFLASMLEKRAQAAMRNICTENWERSLAVMLGYTLLAHAFRCLDTTLLMVYVSVPIFAVLYLT